MIRTMSLSLLAGAAVSFGATGVALGETDAPAGASSDAGAGTVIGAGIVVDWYCG